MESSFSGSSKRAKAPVNVTQVVHCLVDGCNSDLNQCREYHRRHKVCEIHSKTPKVTIGGREQRFCQQCSRFHSLVEFDEGKRSCRKRLDGHNRRRRKPQPETLSRSSGMPLSSQQGTRLLSFNNPQIFSTAVVSSTWAGLVKAEDETLLYNSHPTLNYIDRHDQFPESSTLSSYNGVNQIQFLQDTDHALPEASVCQPLLDPNSASGHSSSSQIMFSDGLNRVVDSDRALSLLSPAPPVHREIGLSYMVQPDPNTQAQSLIYNLQCSNMSQYAFTPEMQSKPVVSTTDSDNSHNAATLHFQEIFQNGPDGSSASGSHQTLTFRWD
ncbi:unnamed protein product [Ilex paraguariensis]|uniref:SBP-type domain-containing protein n=1 Tax=Ilex paraguariensis TaxID=185542 RepID=A0ABC8RQM9_9AQUA